MSLELLSKLESKIQNALEAIELQKMEIDELKQTNSELNTENEKLKQDLSSWNDKVNGLVGLLNDEISE
ncbi:cell division protein ZapB [Shewanella sp. 202IG2-18]|uniref:cell division protein ZapB n=1 Tax=Parashewanella hymeniacidonis TaxID=2807618 RepID=UPI00195F7A6A|nr:cell division protein ZapB [Parashewanella hymeniacidonis]MBM7071199.1 cell division protein ZapB [Parashewanella hymeniacidonis]